MSRIAAIIVTRGDHDLSEILDSYPTDWERIVWDNGTRELLRYLPGAFTATFSGNDHTGPLRDVSVYGRYAAIAHALDSDVVFVQDDDLVLPIESIEAIADAYEPGHVVCNMPERFRDTGFYDDHALVGFGALFPRELPEIAFQRFTDYGVTVPLGTEQAFFYRTCDVVFTALTPRVLVDVPYRNLPWAEAADRMYRQEGHVGERQRMLELARAVRHGVAT
jgi:hypothetical protein